MPDTGETPIHITAMRYYPLMPEEAKFWMDTAKKEYFFKMDRKVKYEGTAVGEIKNVSMDSTGGVVKDIQPKTEEEAK